MRKTFPKTFSWCCGDFLSKKNMILTTKGSYKVFVCKAKKGCNYSGKQH